MNASDFFTLPPSLAPFAAYFKADAAPWEWLKQIAAALASIKTPPPPVDVPPGVNVEGRVWIHPTVRLPAHATLIGPSWIGAKTEVRPGAFVRGNVIVGEGCVIGNSCEFKNCLLLDGVQVPHFSYVGDSILGNRAHLGAGVICSNLRLDQKPVVIRAENATYETGLRKLGAILGDAAEVGCNSVLNPGTLLGRRALISPLTSFSGHLPEGMLAFGRPQMKTIPRPD